LLFAAIPQSVVPSGGHMGTGMNEDVMEEEAIVLADAEDVRVEAAAPVRARTTTKARTMFFMV
jgi:hypothetical protein